MTLGGGNGRSERLKLVMCNLFSVAGFDEFLDLNLPKSDKLNRCDQ